MDATRAESYDMSQYFGMLRRHWWIIALSAAVGVISALGLAHTQTKIYEATTYVLVTPTSSPTPNVLNGRTQALINLDTEAQLVTSAQVATEVAKLLKSTSSPSRLSSNVSIDVPPNTTVLAITYAAPTPAAAQAGSHAFAAAYLDNRTTSAKADLASQMTAITTKIAQQNTSLTKINNEMSGLNSTSAKYANLQSSRSTLTSQINQLTNRLNTLSTTTVSAGQIITDATVPGSAARPVVPLWLASGGMVGLLIGLLIAFARQRVDKRVRFAGDVPRRTGLPLLAILPTRVKTRLDDVYPPYGPAGRTFNRLRNEVLASLEEGDKVIVVTGASTGSACTLVAANLAAALARAGSEVVYVGAHLPDNLIDTAPTTRLFGVAPTPGLSDVLAGKVPLDTATQIAPRNPWLRVITTGGTASAAGFLQSQTLRDILAHLRTSADYVVIEAPSTANTADAQSLASLGDASIVVVELRRTTHSEVLDAADQLRRVGTATLGAVVLPRLHRVTDELPAPPPGRPLVAEVPPRNRGYADNMPTTRLDLDPHAAGQAADTEVLAFGAALGSEQFPPSSVRRRILPPRRGERRVPGRRGSRPRPHGLPPQMSAETIVFDGPVNTSTAPAQSAPAKPAGAAPEKRAEPTRSEAPAAAGKVTSTGPAAGKSGPAGATSAKKAAGKTAADKAGAAKAEPPKTEPTRATPANAEPAEAEPTKAEPTKAEPTNPVADKAPAAKAPAEQVPAQPEPAAKAETPAQPVPAEEAKRTRTLTGVTLPPASAAQATPVNPTSITGPVLGATSIVINTAAEPRKSAESPSLAVANATSDHPNAAGKVAAASGAKNAPGSGTTPTGVKRVSGTAGSPDGPRAGVADETAILQRINLVYVDEGDNDRKER